MCEVHDEYVQECVTAAMLVYSKQENTQREEDGGVRMLEREPHLRVHARCKI